MWRLDTGLSALVNVSCKHVVREHVSWFMTAIGQSYQISAWADLTVQPPWVITASPLAKSFDAPLTEGKACFVYGGHSLIVVCDINTERDSGTSVSKQQEPSLYSSCPGVRLVFSVRECLRAFDACGNHRVFSCLVFIWGVVCQGILNSCILVSDVWPSHFCQKKANNAV